MDKKNTMLLTVIAVATLLVAVVGATFAYFTASASGSSTTTVTATTENIAAVTLSGPTPTLSLTLAATDFAQETGAYKAYWATNSSTANYDSTATQRAVATATVGDGGSATAKYQCTVTLKVSVTGTMASSLTADDAYIQFGGLKTDKVALSTLVADGGSYPITFDLTGTNKTASVTAAVAIENRNANQTALAGKTLTVSFTDNGDFTCKVVQ